MFVTIHTGGVSVFMVRLEVLKSKARDVAGENVTGTSIINTPVSGSERKTMLVIRHIKRTGNTNKWLATLHGYIMEKEHQIIYAPLHNYNHEKIENFAHKTK